MKCLLKLAALFLLFPGTATALELPSSDAPLWSGASYNDAVPATGADRLHALGITGKGVTTAIIDSGFDLGHEIFANTTIVNGYAYSGSGGEHGTAVAGIALSMAPDSDLWLKQLSSEEDAIVTEDFDELLRDAARYGVASLNVSWGDFPEGLYGSPGEVAAANPLTAEMVRALLDAGVTITAAAGNSSVNGRMSFPDGLPGVLSVGSLDNYGRAAAHSTLYGKDGQGLFLLAPGVSVTSAAAGPGPDGYATNYGTSLAAPHVAGAITLLKSGARAASTEEITAALYDSAARVAYDPDEWIDDGLIEDYYVDPDVAYAILLELADSESNLLDLYKAWLEYATPLYADNDFTAEEWRMLNRIAMTALTIIEYFNTAESAFTTPDGETLHGSALFVKLAEILDIFAPMEETEFGFLQVDAAYRLLTSRRAELMEASAASFGSAHAGAFAGFSGALGASLDQNLADLFQRLDGQPAEVLVRAARQLGPGWAASTLQSSVFGQLGLHAATERRLEHFRNRARSRGSESAAAPGGEGLMSLTLPEDWIAWAESFGSYHDRTETRDGSGWHGSFAGLMAGMEKDCGEGMFGAFAAWANHNISGDGSSRGNWGTFGAYGGLSRDAFSAALSLSVGVGDYGLTRSVDGPAAAFAGMRYGAVRTGAKSDPAAVSLSARGTAEWTLLEQDGWKIAPGVEAALAHTFMSGFTEHSGGGINLSVRRHSESYAETGAGLRVSKTFFREGCQPFLTASVKMSGLYGASFGPDMRARFAAGGSSFSVEPERIKTGWFVPEAALSWQATERTTVSLSYQGRFGRHSSANTGTLSVGLNW